MGGEAISSGPKGVRAFLTISFFFPTLLASGQGVNYNGLRLKTSCGLTECTSR
jgi:hypothetical protein